MITLDDQDLASLLAMDDNELVKNAGSPDMAVIVLANVRLRASTERLRTSTERLTIWLIGWTVALFVLTGALVGIDFWKELGPHVGGLIK